MDTFFVVENLDALSFEVVIRSLAQFSDKMSIVFPKTGYTDVDCNKIVQSVSSLNNRYIAEREVSFDIYSVVVRTYSLDENSLDDLLKICSLPAGWDWVQNRPEDIIFYRPDSDLVLYETYSVDNLNMAILTKNEIEKFTYLVKEQGKIKITPFESFLKKKSLGEDQPRLAAAIRAYQESFDKI